MTQDEELYYSIATEPPPAANDRRRGFRRPLGTIATLARVVGSEELNRLHVLVMDVSSDGVGLRCPVPLPRGSVYRLRIGAARQTRGDTTSHVRVVTARLREDGTFDVGLTYLGELQAA